jgi:catechol O-methyltransferase
MSLNAAGEMISERHPQHANNCLRCDISVKIFFIDHDKSLYVTDAKRILESGTLHDSSLLIADNVLFPGTPDYLEFLEKEPSLTPTLNKVPIEQLPILDDAISIATYSG